MNKRNLLDLLQASDEPAWRSSTMQSSLSTHAGIILTNSVSVIWSSVRISALPSLLPSANEYLAVSSQAKSSIQVRGTKILSTKSVLPAIFHRL